MTINPTTCLHGATTAIDPGIDYCQTCGGYLVWCDVAEEHLTNLPTGGDRSGRHWHTVESLYNATRLANFVQSEPSFWPARYGTKRVH